MASTSSFRLASFVPSDAVPPAADAPLFGVFALGASPESTSMNVDPDPSRSHAPPVSPVNHTNTNTNCSNDTNANFNLSHFARSLAPSSPARYSAEEFADADLSTKHSVLEHLASPSGLGVLELVKLATLHVGFSAYKPDRTKKNAKDLRADLLRHRCCDECLLRRSHAISAGVLNLAPLPRLRFLESAKLLRLRLTAPVARPKRKRPDDAADSSPRKKQRTVPAPPLPRDHVSAVGSPVPDHLFRILSWDEKCDIMHEFREATGNRAMARVECSFCGAREVLDGAAYIRTDCLDTSLLENAVARLRELFHQPRIQVFRPETLVNESYVLCADCRREVTGSEFKAIPLRSYANGLWTGLCPPELSGLTFLEEQCIARARATSCMFKLELGASGQYASRGNVCILPHDPTPFATTLPPPLSVFRDEISIILVGSPDTTVTSDMLLRTPILVRRQRIINALLWLRENNPLYGDLDVASIHRNASSYPEEGLPLPVEDFLRTSANASEGSSYVHDASDQLHPNVNLHSMPTSTLQDLDRTDATFQDRKLVHLDLIKQNLHRFIKFPSGSTPMNTRDNPAMFGRLFPTLFPYGVGMMENSDVYLDQSAPFRKVFLRSHVAHLLQRGPDDRFQKHMSFLFVVGNILQRRQSAFDAKLAVKKSWFPKVQSLFRQIDADTISTYREKLKKNPFAKADTPGEKAAATLVNYVSYVAENIPGSTAEIQHMRREMYSIVHCEGLPHVFFTLNPADVLNPIAQVLAGRDIDLDRVFHDLAPGVEREKRSTAIGTNPVAASEFFHLSVDALVKILFGVGRSNGVGIYGQVSAYYGVVEAQGRGSLHIHMLLWLKDGLSPLELLDHIRSDPQFAQRVYDWFDDVFAFSLPDNTSSYSAPVPGTYSKYPVMCRPPDARDPLFRQAFNQELRDVLENVAQIHKHNDTCFKYLPKTLKDRRDADADCRFNLPRPVVLKTHIDDEGILHLRCNDGRVNGHNPIATVTQRCNTDSKPIGSGTVAMAMFGYMGNYTIKGPSG
uniref:Helitron helicase-like domain-containing protein n=1 Tax=Mycena chlorophos TaxID=658473 RepID=A0ABQ0KY78_MYCCL|nr:predicted protein [Mycena chlorophos]